MSDEEKSPSRTSETSISQEENEPQKIGNCDQQDSDHPSDSEHSSEDLKYVQNSSPNNKLEDDLMRNKTEIENEPISPKAESERSEVSLVDDGKLNESASEVATKNDTSDEGHKVDELYEKLSGSSPEPGELPDDDEPAVSSPAVKLEPEEGEVDGNDGSFDGSRTPDLPDNDENFTVKKTVKLDFMSPSKDETDRSEQKTAKVEHNFEEDYRCPVVKHEFHSDSDEESAPRTPEPKVVPDEKPEPPKKLASIFEKKVKKREWKF